MLWITHYCQQSTKNNENLYTIIETLCYEMRYDMYIYSN